MRWTVAFIWTNLKSFLPNDVVEIGSVAREEFYRRRDRRTHETDFVFHSTLISGELFLAFNMSTLLDKQLYILMWLLNTSLFRIPKTVLVRSNYLICLWKCIFILSIKCVVDTVSADLSWKIRWFFLIIVVCRLSVCSSVYTWHIFHIFKGISCTMQISTELNTIA